ncbi:hypothetical protein, partial [Actinomadura sp. KC216]|uniref:hypothetical protein n=1 Tax=Actinomadura sp. KC216 TaxID=2530370 RepID=UPI001A9DF939
MGRDAVRRCASILPSLLWRRPGWIARLAALTLVAGLVHVPLSAVTRETAAHADEPPKAAKAAVSEEKAVAA